MPGWERDLSVSYIWTNWLLMNAEVALISKEAHLPAGLHAISEPSSGGGLTLCLFGVLKRVLQRRARGSKKRAQLECELLRILSRTQLRKEVACLGDLEILVHRLA